MKQVPCDLCGDAGNSVILNAGFQLNLCWPCIRSCAPIPDNLKPPKVPKPQTARRFNRPGYPLKTRIHNHVPGSASDPCVYCNGIATTIDHIQARSKRGLDDLTNLAPACSPCNAAKGNQSVLLYLATRSDF